VARPGSRIHWHAASKQSGSVSRVEDAANVHRHAMSKHSGRESNSPHPRSPPPYIPQQPQGSITARRKSGNIAPVVVPPSIAKQLNGWAEEGEEGEGAATQPSARSPSGGGLPIGRSDSAQGRSGKASPKTGKAANQASLAGQLADEAKSMYEASRKGGVTAYAASFNDGKAPEQVQVPLSPSAGPLPSNLPAHL
jgi:hypothetical protein